MLLPYFRRGLLVFLLIISIWTLGSDPHGITQSDHGVADEPPVAAASPAMRSFFLNSSDGSLPEAARKNSTGDPLWDLMGRPVPQEEISDGGRDADRRRRTALLAAGVACGVAGAVLLLAAVAVCVAQRRKAEREAAAAAGETWAELRRNPEVL